MLENLDLDKIYNLALIKNKNNLIFILLIKSINI